MLRMKHCRWPTADQALITLHSSLVGLLVKKSSFPWQLAIDSYQSTLSLIMVISWSYVKKIYRKCSTPITSPRNAFLNLDTVRVWFDMISYKDSRRDILKCSNEITARISLPVDLRVMSGESSKRDELWVTDDGEESVKTFQMPHSVFDISLQNRVRDCCLTPIDLFHVKLWWDDYEVCFVTRSTLCVVLAHWHSISEIDATCYSLIFWILANQNFIG